MKHNSLRYLILSSLIVLIDYLTKEIALKSLILYQAKPIFPSFNLMLAFNKGAAFSFLGHAGGWQKYLFIVIAIIVSIMIIVWLYNLPKEDKWTGISLGLILGGGIGKCFGPYSIRSRS